MTMTLAHPPAEDLGRFIDGTLDDPARAALVEHIADCDECRVVVVDATAFGEEDVATSQGSGRRWLATAAAVVLMASVGTLTYTQLHNPLAKTIDDSAKLKLRQTEGRLSGFQYGEWHVNRGGGSDEEEDPLLAVVQGDAATAAQLSGNSPKTLHARGIGLLLEGKETVDSSLGPLTSAAAKEPTNAQYQNDLAVALIAASRSTDHAKLQLAVDACDRALQIDPASGDALFNRALALERLGRNREAIAAFNRYLKFHQSSRWAGEARDHIEALTELLR